MMVLEKIKWSVIAMALWFCIYQVAILINNTPLY